MLMVCSCSYDFLQISITSSGTSLNTKERQLSGHISKKWELDNYNKKVKKSSYKHNIETNHHLKRQTLSFNITATLKSQSWKICVYDIK